MNRHQVAGHLGMANNPQFSPAQQHASRVAIISAASGSGSGRSASSIAGQIGATTNPSFFSSTQHSARVAVISAATSK